MQKQHRIKIIKRTSLILIITGLLLTHFFIPRLITEIKNPVVSLIKRNKNISYKAISDDSSEFKRKELIIQSYDDIKLSALLTYSNTEETKGTIILLHGIRSNKNTFFDLTEFLANNGFNSVALDSRAHGESEGQFCTFGVNEKKDIEEVINYLAQNENLSHIVIWGQSLGGAIGLQAMGYDNRIKFGIIESTFSDFKTIVNDYFHLHAGFSFSPFSNYLVSRAGHIGEFNSDDAKPIKYCENIQQPILMVHGNMDERISIKYAKANFSKLKSIDKEFIEIDSANHSNVWKVGGADYFERILVFLNKQQNKNPNN